MNRQNNMPITHRTEHTSVVAVDTDFRKDIEAIWNVQDVYTYHVRQFCGWLKDTDNQLDEQGVRTYFEFLNSTGYAAGTIRLKRLAVKKRLRVFARDWDEKAREKLEQVLSDADADIKAPKSEAKITREKTIGLVEYSKLLERCRSTRTKLMMQFLWISGCRISEMLGAKIENCEIQNTKMLIKVLGKGSKERTVKIPIELWQQIDECFHPWEYLFETSNHKPYLRTYVGNEIRKLGRRVLGRDIYPHMFRHSFGSRKIAQTGKIKAVSDYMGHSDVTITMRFYVHEELSDDELLMDEIAG